MGKKARIRAVVEYAQKEHDKVLKKKPFLASSLKYRWGHTLRVAQRGMGLAKEENANLEQVIVACLLHDIAKLSNTSHSVDHGRVGAKQVRPVLKKIGYSKTQINRICYAIAAHVDGKAAFKNHHSLVADIVSDADKIDRFSVYRTVLRLEGGRKNYREVKHYKRRKRWLG